MAETSPAAEPAKPRIFSGIRATGDKTLGNYSGGYRQYAATQDQGDAFFCIVDLHSITTPIEPITVASRPGVTCAAAPASASRATTSSTWSEVACALMTIRSSGEPVTAIAPV